MRWPLDGEKTPWRGKRGRLSLTTHGEAGGLMERDEITTDIRPVASSSRRVSQHQPTPTPHVSDLCRPHLAWPTSNVSGSHSNPSASSFSSAGKAFRPGGQCRSGYSHAGASRGLRHSNPCLVGSVDRGNFTASTVQTTADESHSLRLCAYFRQQASRAPSYRHSNANASLEKSTTMRRFSACYNTAVSERTGHTIFLGRSIQRAI
ncbi:hypothetical protein JOL62DRAFT_391895 [Phyllosticta paracitricarpa]|uniref:Uncharacterized protein n=1 Tax=Phyllosticta paracitricarpa TaxID=2016321 RepID=A0ABR1MUN7_9PEZI